MNSEKIVPFLAVMRYINGGGYIAEGYDYDPDVLDNVGDIFEMYRDEDGFSSDNMAIIRELGRYMIDMGNYSLFSSHVVGITGEYLDEDRQKIVDLMEEAGPTTNRYREWDRFEDSIEQIMFNVTRGTNVDYIRELYFSDDVEVFAHALPSSTVLLIEGALNS